MPDRAGTDPRAPRGTPPVIGYVEEMADPKNDQVGSPARSAVPRGDPADDLQIEIRERDVEPPRSADRAPRVVVGIDGSAESRAAVQWAVAYACQAGAEVHAVPVWHEPLRFGVGAMSRVPDRQFDARRVAGSPT